MRSNVVRNYKVISVLHGELFVEISFVFCNNVRCTILSGCDVSLKERKLLFSNLACFRVLVEERLALLTKKRSENERKGFIVTEAPQIKKLTQVPMWIEHRHRQLRPAQSPSPNLHGSKRRSCNKHLNRKHCIVQGYHRRMCCTFSHLICNASQCKDAGDSPRNSEKIETPWKSRKIRKQAGFSWLSDTKPGWPRFKKCSQPDERCIHFNRHTLSMKFSVKLNRVVHFYILGPEPF